MRLRALRETLHNLARPRVLVLGDLLLTRPTAGKKPAAHQASSHPAHPTGSGSGKGTQTPESVKGDSRCGPLTQPQLAGAAGVCQCLQALQADVTLLGVLGGDEPAEQLRLVLGDLGVNHAPIVIDPQRSTHLGSPAVARLLEGHHAVVICDAGFGLCTPRVLASVIQQAKGSDIPVIAGGLGTGELGHYFGLDYLALDERFAQRMNRRPLRGAREANFVGAQLCRQLNAKATLVSLGEGGIALVPRDGGGVVYPAPLGALRDDTATHETLVATFVLGLAGGSTVVDAARLSALTTGWQRGRVGCQPISRDELSRNLSSYDPSSQRPHADDPQQGLGSAGNPRDSILGEVPTRPFGPGSTQSPGQKNSPKIVTLQELVEKLGPPHQRTAPVVFTHGCFDLFGDSHRAHLKEAADLGEVLVVGLHTDAHIRQLRGPIRPVIRQSDRAALLAALVEVEYVVFFDEETGRELLARLQPDVLLADDAERPEEIEGYDIVSSYGGKVCLREGVAALPDGQLLQPHFLSSPQPTEATLRFPGSSPES